MPATHKLIIKDKGWDELIKEHKELNRIKIKVGLFGNGKPNQNLAARGAVHTFGIPKGIKITDKMRRFLHSIGIHVKKSTTHIFIPQRPFMQNAMDDNESKLFNFIKKNYILLIQDKIDLDTFLKRIGIKHKDQIKLSIKKGTYDALHPVTIARKGSSKPLIDSSEMINGVKYEVKK